MRVEEDKTGKTLLKGKTGGDSGGRTGTSVFILVKYWFTATTRKICGAASQHPPRAFQKTRLSHRPLIHELRLHGILGAANESQRETETLQVTLSQRKRTARAFVTQALLRSRSSKGEPWTYKVF